MKTLARLTYKEGIIDLKEEISKSFPIDAIEALDSDAEALQQEHRSILKLNVGDIAPDFILSNTDNQHVKLYDILRTKRVVLTFYRGTWCPYCNFILKLYQEVLPEIENAGATLIAISPQTPDESLKMKEQNSLDFEVLSDNGNLITKEFVTVHEYPKKSAQKLEELGYEYDSYYADEQSEIPIPAVFIIEQDGTVSFAKSEGGDFRNRVEPSDIIKELNQ